MDETCAPSPTASALPPARHLGYQPALDGVRGVAVALVVIFHLDAGVVTGGYLGVSVFFTLSGFLITSLLLERHRDDGTMGLGQFYVRRIKRLVPASSATLLAVALVTASGGFLATDRSAGDLVAASLNVFNWRELTSGRAYADLFAGHSPVAHFWSLAIEEQFYVVWPLALLAMLRWRRIAQRRLLVAVVALFLAASIAARFGSANVAYFASWTRAAEILAGAALAVWILRCERIPTWWRHLAGPAVAIVVALSLVTPAATGWAYSGGLPVFSLVSVALIAGLQVPGRVRSALSVGPLVGLGRISYGVYLVHWPVFVYVDEVRMGVDGWNLTVTRLGLTALISLVMYAVLERPVRLSGRPATIGRALALTVACSLLVVTVTRVSIDPPSTAAAAPAVLAAPAPATDDPTTDEQTPGDPASARPVSEPTENGPSSAAVVTETIGTETIGTAVETTADDATTPASDPVARTVVPVEAAEPTSIAVFGDSVPAWILRDAALAFARRDVVLLNGAMAACDGAVAIPVGRDRRGTEIRPPEGCQEWTQSYPQTLASYDRPVDVGLLVIGQVLAVDRLVDGEWRHPCDTSEWYVDDVRERVAFLRTEGVTPVIALPARFGQRASYIVPDDYDDRMSCVRTALFALSLEQFVPVVDLDTLLCLGDDCDGRRIRDGIHVDPEAAAVVLDELVDLTLAAR